MKKLIERAQKLMEQNFSDGYIISLMWAERDWITSISDITTAVETARQTLKKAG